MQVSELGLEPGLQLPGPAVPSARASQVFTQPPHSQGSQTLHRAALKWPVCQACGSVTRERWPHSPDRALRSRAAGSRLRPLLKDKGPGGTANCAFSEELQAKQMVGMQLVEYFYTLIKQFSCGPLNFLSLNEHRLAWRQL